MLSSYDVIPMEDSCALCSTLSAQQVAVADVPALLPGRGEVQIFGGLRRSLRYGSAHLSRPYGCASGSPPTFGHEMSGVDHCRGRGRRELDRRGPCHGHAALLGRHMPGLSRWATSTSARTSTSSGSTPPERCRNAGTFLTRLWSRLPTSLALDEAALVEPVAVAVHDVRRSELIRATGRWCSAAGRSECSSPRWPATRVPRSSSLNSTSAAARRSRTWAFATLDPAAQDLTQVSCFNEWTADAGADVVFEVSGAAAAVAQRHVAAEGARHAGGRRHPPAAARRRPAAGVLAGTAASWGRAYTRAQTSRGQSNWSPAESSPRAR